MQTLLCVISECNTLHGIYIIAAATLNFPFGWNLPITSATHLEQCIVTTFNIMLHYCIKTAFSDSDPGNIPFMLGAFQWNTGGRQWIPVSFSL